MITHVKHNVCIVISSTLRHENSRCTFHMHQMIHKLRHKIKKYLFKYHILRNILEKAVCQFQPTTR